MKKIILISMLSLFVFTGCQSSNDDIEENSNYNSSLENFDVISTTMDESSSSKQDLQLSVTDISEESDKAFVFTKDHEKIDIHMKENIYIDLFQDIMLNPENYLGKTICVEGMYTVWSYHDGSEYNFVYRYGPEGCPCCGGNFYGLEFTYDDNLPKENDWIEVVGVLDEYMEDGFPFLTLRCISVKVLDKRGKEDLS